VPAAELQSVGVGARLTLLTPAGSCGVWRSEVSPITARCIAWDESGNLQVRRSSLSVIVAQGLLRAAMARLQREQIATSRRVAESLAATGTRALMLRPRVRPARRSAAALTVATADVTGGRRTTVREAEQCTGGRRDAGGRPTPKSVVGGVRVPPPLPVQCMATQGFQRSDVRTVGHLALILLPPARKREPTFTVVLVTPDHSMVAV